jgi:hypothetical protein
MILCGDVPTKDGSGKGVGQLGKGCDGNPRKRKGKNQEVSALVFPSALKLFQHSFFRKLRSFHTVLISSFQNNSPN